MAPFWVGVSSIADQFRRTFALFSLQLQFPDPKMKVVTKSKPFWFGCVSASVLIRFGFGSDTVLVKLVPKLGKKSWLQNGCSKTDSILVPV